MLSGMDLLVSRMNRSFMRSIVHWMTLFLMHKVALALVHDFMWFFVDTVLSFFVVWLIIH